MVLSQIKYLYFPYMTVGEKNCKTKGKYGQDFTLYCLVLYNIRDILISQFVPFMILVFRSFDSVRWCHPLLLWVGTKGPHHDSLELFLKWTNWCYLGSLLYIFLIYFIKSFLMLKLLHHFPYLSSISPILTSLFALSHANRLFFFAFICMDSIFIWIYILI